MSQVIEHPGTILTIQNGVARIQITQYAACSGCHARSVCLISDCREKVIEVPCSETSWQAGDTVTIRNSRTGTAFRVRCTLTDRQRGILLAGGLMAQSKAK